MAAKPGCQCIVHLTQIDTLEAILHNIYRCVINNHILLSVADYIHIIIIEMHDKECNTLVFFSCQMFPQSPWVGTCCARERCWQKRRKCDTSMLARWNTFLIFTHCKTTEICELLYMVWLMQGFITNSILITVLWLFYFNNEIV